MRKPILAVLFALTLLITTVCSCSSEQTGSGEMSEIFYVTRDNTPVYSEPDDTSSCITYVDEGDNVLVMSYSGVFSKVMTSSNKTGYIIRNCLSPDDPLTEMTTEVSSEPEPSMSSSVEETNEPAPTETPTPTPEPTATPSPTPKPVAKKVVKVRNRYIKTRTFSGIGKVTCKVPKVYISGVDTSAVNDKIYKKLKSSVNSFKKAGKKIDDYARYATYECYIGKGFVSIITWNEYCGLDGPYFPTHNVYNIDTSDGHLMTKEEALKKFGISEKKFTKEVKRQLSDLWKREPGSLIPEEEYHDSFNKAAVNKAIPYVNKSGRLSFAVRIFVPAGPEAHDTEYKTKYKVK